jgi:hypothetical protein
MSIASNLVISPVARDAGERTLTLAQGGWLATANYLGYLAGALICMATVIRPAVAIRFGLVCVASFTMAMAASDRLPLWVIFRSLAGLAVLLCWSGFPLGLLPRLLCFPHRVIGYK